jgi:hypothetical protein
MARSRPKFFLTSSRGFAQEHDCGYVGASLGEWSCQAGRCRCRREWEKTQANVVRGEADLAEN